MANHKSALKRARQNETRRLRNVKVKTFIRTRVRKVREAVAAGRADDAQDLLKGAMSALHRGASKGVIHARTADRRIGRLSKLVDSARS